MEIPIEHGLSILIPIYNWSVVDLVLELSSQATRLKIPYEIICFDDGSDEYWKNINRTLLTKNSVIYQEMATNLGRSKIRNILAIASRYHNLIFLDCDCALTSDKFIANYWDKQNFEVITGGREYKNTAPEEKFMLHWKIGKARETKDAAYRNKNPYRSFMFNNVFMHRSIFLDIQLDERIYTYGHEDTKFGYELEKKRIPVMHLNNQTLHIGLDEKEKFLSKTIDGVKNLRKISEIGLTQDTRLYKFAMLLRKTHSEKLFLLLYFKLLESTINTNLRSSNPSLLYFDLFKLNAFLKAKD